MKENAFRPSQESIAEFCRRHHIRWLAFFGSVLRDDVGPQSDIDVLVEFEEGHVPGFFGLARIEEELAQLFGRKVDLNTPMSLSDHFREHVLREAEVHYGQTSGPR
ncbi:MAG: nucleotidyltransferase family protein [Chloroflexi bacterium]|nr:nucleotidyltransferase family protein [Chloroflexota bacterium]